jgi:hypothetical protein
MHLRGLLLASVLAIPPALTLAPGSLVSALISAPDGLPGLPTGRAEASVSVLLSLDELVAGSTHVVVATAGERRSVWEDLPSGRRIVTYTRLAVERSVAGAPVKEVWVRTLGGVVGRLGQSVAGEAQMPAGSRALLFLAEARGVVVVAGRAQGHYPIKVEADGIAKLAPSLDAGMLVPRRGPTISAREQLVGRALDDAAAVVTAAFRARQGDGPK